MHRLALLLTSSALLCACSPERETPANDVLPTETINATETAEPAIPAPPATPAPLELIGDAVARAEWSKAANKSSCAPLALRADGEVDATPRRAEFSGGWAVAFDQPGRRSAFGFAGTGLLPADRADFAAKVDVLARQWPLIRRWDAGENLPAGAAAGYGLEGARPYLEGSQAVGQQSLAYVRIPGQTCLYNVWSKLGRDHLESLLARLTVIEGN